MSETDFDLAALEAATRKMPGNYTRTELALVAECRKLTDENAQLKADLLALLKMPDAAQAWVPCSAFLPPPHEDVWCLNRDGRQFAGRICYGMHKPFFTYPHGDGSPSNTAPNWIDVTHWCPLPAPPQGGAT